MRIRRSCFGLLAGLFFLTGCGLSAYHNRALTPDSPPVKASFEAVQPRGREDVLVALALSGGGSRAAYFSAAVMLRLQEVFPDLDLLKEVDVISSVSGGSLPAAYYCISGDPGGVPIKSNRIWEEKTVREIMGRDYLTRWVGNWFWPPNALRFWLTAYDRTDIMAQTLEDNFLDVTPYGRGLRFRDMNPERPYLIINATDATRGNFGEPFTYTREDFEDFLESEIGSYRLAWAVMGSAAFPGAFNFQTLHNYGSEDERYRHVFDGGNADNLGLSSIKRVIRKAEKDGRPYRHYVIILVDSYTEAQGVTYARSDPREFADFLLDRNVMNSFDCLMKTIRTNRIDEFAKGNIGLEQKPHLDNLTFLHLQFADLPSTIEDPLDKRKSLRQSLNEIPTSFKISESDRKRIDAAVDILMVGNNPVLQEMRRVLE